MILGIDPGTAHIGLAVLTDEGEFCSAATLDDTQYAATSAGGRHAVKLVRAWVRELRAASLLVAIEKVETVAARPGFCATMARDLVGGHGVGQRLVQALEDDGVRVVEVAAETVREHFFGVRAVKGAAVAALLAAQCPGWPKPRTRGIDGHARDAGAIALWAARTQP